MFEKISFNATDGTVLRGRLYRTTDTAPPAPIIILTGGFSSVIEMQLWQFAEAFASGGLNVLAYDHRNFGESDGEVRLEIDPFQQVNDMRDAITFAQTLPGIDPAKIGIWGSSYSGGHVLMLGATDRRVKCVVSQVPFISGNQTMARQLRPDLLEMTRGMFAGDRAARFAGAAPAMLPVVTADPMQPASLPTADAYAWAERHKGTAPSWQNAITLRSMELAGAYEPGAYIAFITPTPLLMIVGTHDQVTVPDVALEAFARAREPKQLELLNGTHFDPYDALFERASGAATQWFCKHLM